MKRLLLIIGLILCLAAPGWATEWHVKPFQVGGYGTSSGADETNAWCLGPTSVFEADLAGGGTADRLNLMPMDGAAVFLFGTAAPGGVTLGNTYYLKRVSFGVYNIETTPGGGGIQITSAGSAVGVYIDGYGQISHGSVTIGVANPGTLTFGGAAFGFGTGYENQPVFVYSTGNLPKISAGDVTPAEPDGRLQANTPYFTFPTGNYNFKLRRTSGGAAIDLDPTDIGSGVCYVSYINYNQVAAGDTVWFHGRFQDNKSGATTPIGHLCYPGVYKGGSAGNPIIYRGAADCEFYGTYYHYPSGAALWVQHATVPAVYTRTLSGTVVFYERNNITETPLRLNLRQRYVSSPATVNELSQFDPGDWGRDAANVLYIRPRTENNANPNNNVYFMTTGSYLNVFAVDYVTLRDLKLYGNLAIRPVSAKNLTIDGCTVDSVGTAIQPSGQCDNLEVKNSTIGPCANGLYTTVKVLGVLASPFKAGENIYRTGLSLHDNIFSNTDTRCGPATGVDYHGIGLQNDVTVAAYRNSFNNFSTGITYYSDGANNGDIEMYGNASKRIWRACSPMNIDYIKPGVTTTIVAFNHPFVNGNAITIAGITQANWTNANGAWVVAAKTADTFTILLDSSGPPYTDDYVPDTDAGTVKLTSNTDPMSYHGWAYDVHGLAGANITYSIHHNIGWDLDGGLVRAGQTGNAGTHKVYHNTGYDMAIGTAWGVNTATPINFYHKNNAYHTIVDKGTGLVPSFVYAGGTGDPANWTSTEVDYNLYYPMAGTPFRWIQGGATSLTLAQWQAKVMSGASPDANCKTIDPRFKNASGLLNVVTDFLSTLNTPVVQPIPGYPTDYLGKQGTPTVGAYYRQDDAGAVGP